MNHEREMAMADEMIMSMRRNAEAKELIGDPDVRSQKESNRWHIDNQFALAFPLCAKYTMDVAADAPAVTNPSIAWKNKKKKLHVCLGSTVKKL